MPLSSPGCNYKYCYTVLILFFRSCPRCHQMYTGDLNKDMSEGFIAFINEKYPNSLPLRIRGKISLLEHYVGAIDLNHKDHAAKEAVSIANDVISMSMRIKVRNMRQYKNESIHLYETYAFTSIGSISANNLRDFPIDWSIWEKL